MFPSGWNKSMGPHSCHSVCNGIGEGYAASGAFHFGIERCSSDDYFIEITAEYFHCLFAHVSLILSLTMGIRNSSLPILLVYPGQDILL